MKKIKRIIFFIEENEMDKEICEEKNNFILVFSTTPKNCYSDYCFAKKHLNRELGEIL